MSRPLPSIVLVVAASALAQVPTTVETHAVPDVKASAAALVTEQPPPSAAAASPAAVATSDTSLVTWVPLMDLPSLPGQVKPGLAGVFAGALDVDHLVVAGGSFYGEKGPLEGGVKSFADGMLVLEKKPGPHGEIPAYGWVEQPTKLPRPLAHGVSVALDDGVLCCGGTDGQTCFSETFLLRWSADAHSVEKIEFPLLPKPLAFAGGARVGSWVILAGGTTSPGGVSGADTFGLDLSQRGDPATFQWQTLRSMPRAVHFPVCIGQNDGTGDALFVLGGRDLRAGQEGPPLSDGIKFSVNTRTWVSCGAIKPAGSSTPVALMSAAGVPLEPNRLLVLGGDDGQIAGLLEANARRVATAEERDAFKRFNEALIGVHPGYRREMLLCDTATGQWRGAGFFPQGTPAVTPAFLWDGAIVLASGETRPGQRSATVWLGKLEAP